MADLTQAKRPLTPLAGPYGHPLHPMLIPVPIGAWIAALVFDIGSHVVDDPRFLADGARWLVGLGIAGALAAATLGFLDLLAIPPRTRAMRVALIHMSVNLVATAIFAGSLALRWNGGSDAVSGGVTALDVLGVLLLAVGGYLGGELAYRYGVRVADEQVQAEGFTPTAPAPGNRS